MNSNKEFLSVTERLIAGYENTYLRGDGGISYPDTGAIVAVIEKIRMLIFPGLFEKIPETESIEDWAQYMLAGVYRELSAEIKKALLKLNDTDCIEDINTRVSDISQCVTGKLADIQQLLYKDAQAGFDGDPAARSVEEVILTYPGFFAVLVHRIAHCLFMENVPLIPRIMSEYAHSLTGIDIHPGASIGEYFFIDHGTGVVVGETTVIGNHVKLYQGVTLGALSTKGGQKLAATRRHPTIEDNVTIYAGATILGGETIVGENSTIGGNVFIVESIPRDSRVRGI